MLDINKQSTSLTEQERQQILFDWNATEQAYPYAQCLHQLFEDQVTRTPDEPAVLFDNLCLTYQELNDHANQLAHYLQRLGVGPDVLVGVYMERSLEMIIGLLGILKAGGAYVPLDPTYPSERVTFMLEDLATRLPHEFPETRVGASPGVRPLPDEQSMLARGRTPDDAPTGQLIVLAQPHLIGQLPEHNAHVICLAIKNEGDAVGPLQFMDDGHDEICSLQETINPICQATANNLAYVIYTSGSTGKPKGAMNTHLGICNRLLWMQEEYQLTASDAVLQKTPFSFDVSVWEFFWPLLTGARLIIARPEGHKDSAYLISLIQQQQITTLHFVPSMLQLFLEEPGIEACTSLRQVICSGESLSYELQERFFARHPAALHNLYGPTEAAIDVTYWACQRNSERHSVPIGYPIANTQLYILDPDGNPVPVGAQGELYIGGVGVARGYLNRPELTAERFVHDPFSVRPDARLYRTGDIARYLPDGAIECLGRLDQQVKLRGFRIELGEIETVLVHSPAVREAVVTVREDIPGDKRLVAYVVFHKDLRISIPELRQHMQQHVPPYMVPSLFVELAAFPLNTSGKVDRRALPAPDAVRPDLQQPFVAPRTPTEEVIADVWAQVLGVNQVGVDDNFFMFGGHSLLAMRATTLLRTILQVEIPLRSFFDAPTVAQFAERVDQLKIAEDVLPLSQLQALPREIYMKAASSLSLPHDAVLLPASFAQQRLWFMDQLDPHNAAYNIPASLHFHGQLDISALQQSLIEMARRHEILRTTFMQIDGQPMQVIVPDVPQSAMGAMGAINLAPTMTLREEAEKPFDLAQGPLWRVTLFELEPEHFMVFLLMHHSIADGWSVGLFFEEFTTLYTAFSTGQRSILPDLPVQYADFALWQRTTLSEERLAEHLQYWRQQLADAPEMLELPTDYPRPLNPTHNGATYTFALSSQLSESLRALSRQEGVTLYITLIVAFQTLLHRYTGQDDLVIGTAIADRQQPEVQGLLGLFLNTVALRTNFADNPTVRDLLARVREVVLNAYAHQDLPFERLVQELHSQRSTGRSPLFQVSLQLDPASPVALGKWTLTRMSAETAATKFDLSLELDDHPAGLIGHLEYSTDLFTEPTIARMATHWQNLLEGMVIDPTQPVASLPMLIKAEQYHLLVELNNTSIPYPAAECLHTLFEAQADRTPSEVAVVFEESWLTYQQLNARSNQFAHYLQSLGVGPDILVGICVERSLDMLVALLGILKAGGAYLPLDPSYPAERIAFMLDDAQIGVLVTQQDLVGTGTIEHSLGDRGTRVYSPKIVCIDTDKDKFIHLSEANLAVPVLPSHLAYVIYTSGSTGRPKGVQVSHHALVNFLLSMCQEPGITPQDTLLAVTTLSFDIAGLELYLPLIVGAQLVIASRDVATSGIALAETLVQTHATIMQATPITWRMLLATGWQADASLKMLCGGEALPLDLARQLVSQDASLYNMYGPTETTIWSTLHKFEPEDTFISIGHPIANTTLYILDQHLQLVSMGVSGELYIGGDGLARGYLHRPDLTAERFIRHPFSTDPRARLYRTGDVARYRSDGSIELLGRVDHQIKLRGFRIELGEIEAVLEQHPAVQQTVAIVREDRPGDKRLVAYLLLHNGQHVLTPELQQHASAHLPNYMVPSLFVLLDRLPQTPNGKVDRRALPAPHQELPKQQSNIVAPRTPLEEIIANAWSHVLGITQVSIYANFFALGGHSLLIMQITARLYTSLQINLSLRSFFDAPTVAQLAELITQMQASGSTSQQPMLQQHPGQRQMDNTPTFPLSSAQQALWFIHQLDASNTAYNLPVTLLIHKPLHVETLKQCLNILVQRHEVLRTTFAVVDEQPVQLIASHLDIPITIKDLQHVPASEQASTVQQLATQELQRPFDLAQGPLLRASVFHLSSEEHLLLLVIHHSISDGWSISLLLQEFATLYETFSTSPDRGMSLPAPASESILPDLPLQFRDFAVWQRKWLQSEMFSEHLAYWKQQLADAPTTLALPTDRPRPVQPTYKGAMHTFTLTPELSLELKMLSRKENVTLYMTLVAAFLTFLQRYSGQDDLLLGTTTAGRTSAETQSLVGYFINTLVLRTDLSGNPTVHDLLGRVREVVLSTNAHQHLPFDMLVRELQPDRSQMQSPLFQAFLTLEPPLPELALTYDPTQLDLATGGAKFDLSLELADRPDGIVGHFEYSTDLFDTSTIARMAGHWETLLQAMVNDPTQPLSALPLLTNAEQQQILFDWNNTQVAYPRTGTLAQLFEAQVERTPGASAVTFNATSLSYQDLNAQANQFARYLQGYGIQPGARIALCHERSHELIVALLGILKAGGTYIPLDPAYPSERLAFMLKDSQAEVLVTQQHLLERLPCAGPASFPGDQGRGVTWRAPASWQHDSLAHGRTPGDAPTLISRVSPGEAEALCTTTVICMDREWQTIKQENTENLPCLVNGEDPAYMLYTSGSTGTPKGVLGTHRAALNRFNWMWRTYPFAPGEVCCQKTTLSFVDSVWEIFGPLLQGVQTVIIPDGVVKDPQQFLQTLTTHSVTRIVLVPSLLRVLLDSATARKERVPALKYWICSGEALSLELVRRFQRQLPDCVLLNLYGSSEVAADATFHEIKGNTELSCVPIGRPIDNTQIYLLDRHMQLVPVGVPGELHIGGDGLALGYFKRPELTAAKFVQHPFSTQTAALLYKTGDWARYLPDGTIEYLGRLDHQVKIRGIRIELGEIESVLSQHPLVHEAVVIAREDVPGDQRLVAYVVLHAGKTTLHDELRHYLAERLPAYMVPSTSVYLDALPLTPNGKVDRRALPAPDALRENISAAYVEPQSTLHHQLVQIWEELLNVHPIGMRDDFFALGGHSFLATRLMARIEQVCGKKLPLSILFEGATIEHLANALQTEIQIDSTRTPIIPIRASGTKQPFFFLHGDWQGKALYCLKLAEALGEEQPFYILETYKYNDLKALPSLKEVATAHVAAIRAIQPDGPYTLGGWCNGALFAYEMAQQLEAAGQRVEKLVLMDPGSSSPSGRFLKKVIRRIDDRLHLPQEAQLGWFLRLLHLYEYVRLWNDRKRQGALQLRVGSKGAAAEIEYAHPNFQSPLPSRENLRQNYLSIFNWWASSYEIEPYTGKIAVFWTKDDDAKRRKDWERILIGRKEVEVYFVPGTHVTSRTKYAESLAENLRAYLNNRG
jgi:amino acid adenylation domain-containing protein